MNKKKVLLVVFCICLPLFLLLLSYNVILFSSSLTNEQQEWIDYFDDKVDLPQGYTENEISHMNDVKRVMQIVDYVFYVLLLIVTLIFTHYKKNKNQIKKLLKYGGITTVSVVGIVILLSLVSFNYLFSIK